MSDLKEALEHIENLKVENIKLAVLLNRYRQQEKSRKPITDEQIEEKIALHNYQDMPEFVDGFLSGISFAEQHYGVGGDE